ncbi:unnamed protein product [Cochlearia groenlandica]
MGMAAESQFHVLAVDDSLFDRKLIERLLQKSTSCQVTTVDSGSKALEFLGLRECKDPNRLSTLPQIHQEVEVNLIITDYCMPGMTGYDLLKKVKESTAFKNIPVVIMSSENVPARISRCLKQGAEDFFLKPVRLSDLNKLKPHMLKNQKKLQEIQKPSIHEIETVVATAEEVEFEPEVKDSTEIGIKVLPFQSELQQKKLHVQVVQQEEQTLSNNKRKSVEEGISTDRSRPRFDGITTAV